MLSLVYEKKKVYINSYNFYIIMSIHGNCEEIVLKKQKNCEEILKK